MLLPCKKLSEEGFEVTILPVDSMGRVALDAIREAVTDRTLLISIQAANNEIGTLQPIRAIAEIAHEQGAMIHCDAAQAVGKIPVDVVEWDVDMLSLMLTSCMGPRELALFSCAAVDDPYQSSPSTTAVGRNGAFAPERPTCPLLLGLGKHVVYVAK